MPKDLWVDAAAFPGNPEVTQREHSTWRKSDRWPREYFQPQGVWTNGVGHLLYRNISWLHIGWDTRLFALHIKDESKNRCIDTEALRTEHRHTAESCIPLAGPVLALKVRLY